MGSSSLLIVATAEGAFLSGGKRQESGSKPFQALIERRSASGKRDAQHPFAGRSVGRPMQHHDAMLMHQELPDFFRRRAESAYLHHDEEPAFRHERRDTADT